MPLTPDHHNLFHQSSTADKLALFGSLLQAGAMNAEEALALLASIHAELEEGGVGSLRNRPNRLLF